MQVGAVSARTHLTDDVLVAAPTYNGDVYVADAHTLFHFDDDGVWTVAAVVDGDISAVGAAPEPWSSGAAAL